MSAGSVLMEWAVADQSSNQVKRTNVFSHMSGQYVD